MSNVINAIKRCWSAVVANTAAAINWYANASEQTLTECSDQTVVSSTMKKHMEAMSKRQQFQELVERYEEETAILLPPQFDNALRGVCDSSGRLIAVYSRDQVIEIIKDTSDGELTYWDAVEYFEFNIEPAYTGEPMPIYITDLE